MRVLRWFIIRIAEVFILLVMLAFILGSGAAGYQSVVYFRNEGMVLPFGPGVGFGVGLVLGCILAAVSCAIFFLLVEIANNTRRTVAFFEHIVSRNDAPEG